MASSNPVLAFPPADHTVPSHDIVSDDDDDEQYLPLSCLSQPTSPERLDVVSTSSFVFHRQPQSSNASSPAQRDSSSPTRYADDGGVSGRREQSATGSAVGGATIVEEQIETIITTEEGLDDVLYHNPGDRSLSPVSRGRNLLFADEGECLNVQLDWQQSSLRVPFPELGLDLLDADFASLLTEETRSSEIRLTELKSWDENWLFRQPKKKANSVSSYFAFADLDFASEPVRMFIPNPSHSAKASVGQRDADSLSDLSEKNSVASLSFSSDSESDVDRQSPDLILPPVPKSVMTPGSLVHSNNSSSHKSKVFIVGSDIKSQTVQQSVPQTSSEKSSDASMCRSDIGADEKSSSDCKPTEMRYDHRADETTAATPPTAFKITAAKSCFSVDRSHDPASAAVDAEIAFPVFVPISRRIMASSRTDPAFVIQPVGGSVQSDIVVQFCCRVKGSRPLGVAWFRADHLLTDDNCFRIFSCGNEFVLEIRSTHVSHSDVYSCVVYNGFGEQWSDFRLTVRERIRSPVSTAGIRCPPPEQQEEQRCQDRGSDVYLFRATKSPKVITQTWAERCVVATRDDTMPAPAAPSPPGGTPTRLLSAGSSKERKESKGVSQEEDMNPNSGPGSRGMDQQDKNDVSPAQRPVVLCNRSGRGIGSDSDSAVGSGGQHPALGPERDNEQAAAGRVSELITLSSRCKDLSHYKRDYFVPSARDETLNGLDEQVYQTAKFFSLSEEEKEETASSTDETSILTTGSVTGSLSGSYLSQKDSGQGDERDSTAVEEEDDESECGSGERRAVSPSVRKLVRRFSRKEAAAGLMRRGCTYSSCSNLYDDCDGKGVSPKTCGFSSSEVHSPIDPKTRSTRTGAQNHKSKGKALCGFGSISMCEIDQIKSPFPMGHHQQERPDGRSGAKDGYNSDDSAISGNTCLTNRINQSLTKSTTGSVELLTTKKACRTIMKRASFWQNRCEKGLLSDSSVAEAFPDMDCIFD